MLRLLLWILPGPLLGLGVLALLQSRETTAPHGIAVTGGDFPRTVSSGGDRIVLAAPPQRVVLASTPLVDLGVALVGPERVAAICDQAFTWSVLALDRRGFGDVPVFHEYLAETLLALRPDLVLCNPFSTAGTTARLRESGIPVVPFDHPRSLEAALAQLDAVGWMLGVEARAATVAASVRERAAALAARPGARVGLRAMTYVNHGTGAWSSGGACMIDEWLRLAGLRNAGAELGRQDVFKISTEELLALDPDLIVVTAQLGQAQDPSEALLRGDPNLARLRAVREERILRVHPLDVATTSHEIVAAAERLADAAEALLAQRPR